MLLKVVKLQKTNHEEEFVNKKPKRAGSRALVHTKPIGGHI